MQEVLSRRIGDLVSAGDTLKPAELKAELFDLAQHCRVAPENKFLLKMVAQGLKAAVSEAFGPLTLLLLLTEPRRRQVYFAVLAKMQASGAFISGDFNEHGRAQLLTRFVMASNQDLIASAYGDCPAGFLKLVTRFGAYARSADIYLQLHALLQENPGLAQPLLDGCQGEALKDDIIEMMGELPPTKLSVRVVQKFQSKEEFDKFMQPYTLITGSHRLSEAHMRKIANGETAEGLMEKLYRDIPFPEPALSAPDLTHISNGHGLRKAAKKFGNCMDQFLIKALDGRLQFYIWRPEKAPEVVFSIRRDAPFGWHLKEHKLARNEPLPNELDERFMACLDDWGVRTNGSMAAMVESFLPNDAIDFFEELFLE